MLSLLSWKSAGLQDYKPNLHHIMFNPSLTPQQSMWKEKTEYRAVWILRWENVPYIHRSRHIHHLPLLMSLVRVLVLEGADISAGLEDETVLDWLSLCLTRFRWSSALLARAALNSPRNSSILPCSSLSSSSHGDEPPGQAGGESTRLRLRLGPPLEHNWVGGLPTSPLRLLSGPGGGAWSW